MAVHRYKDLIVWQLANTFKLTTYQLMRESPAAQRNLRFRDQLETSSAAIAKHISEGFLRFSPRELVRFLGYALSSLGEAEGWIQDGIDRGYFTEADSAPLFRLAKRIATGISRLRSAQFRYLEAQPKKISQPSVLEVPDVPEKKDDKPHVPGTRSTPSTRSTRSTDRAPDPRAH
ncbi:MAG TPA: four helix bundle protein [Vicinamibacterales bacterium]|nr:four helix bundle protein [Vicinamibacterales bacterium]